MKKKYFISSSSNIFPNTSYWNNLKETSILEFSNYGDIKDSILSNNYDQSIFLIIFLSDLQIFNNLEKKNKFFLPIFNLLEKRLKNSKYPTFFFFSKYNFEYNILDRINKNFFKIEKNINVFNSYLRRLQNKYSNFYLLDIDSYFSFFGYSNCFDPRNWYLAKARLSAFGIEQLVNLIKICTDKLNSPTKKVLILDCDNTLWGGVVGEDGFKKLIINNESGVGLSFYDFQRIVKKIKNQGVLLALCSKNNENDVWEVFDKNTNMFLSKNDFSIAKINWNEKYKNILEISDDLGLALDSFVFWDDNQI